MLGAYILWVWSCAEGITGLVAEARLSQTTAIIRAVETPAIAGERAH